MRHGLQEYTLLFMVGVRTFLSSVFKTIALINTRSNNHCWLLGLDMNMMIHGQPIWSYSRNSLMLVG